MLQTQEKLDLEKPDFAGTLERILVNVPDTIPTASPLEQRQSQESSTKALSLWKACQITDRHREFKPEDSLNEDWNVQWEKLRPTIGTGVIAVIIGNRGAGKSQMASCAMRVSCKMLRSARYEKAMNFFLDVRKTYKANSEKSESEVIDEYCKPRLLVIDAIENRSESQFENLLLNHLIDLRYDMVLDTILIGNQTEIEFAASMGPSIVDRIHECGVKIVCNWKSFRRK